jgi:chromosome partitioning protein
VILIPNKVPPLPPAAEIKRLGQIVEGTPVQVGPPVPYSSAVPTRKKRMAITSEGPPAKALRPLKASLQAVTAFVKEYVDD